MTYIQTRPQSAVAIGNPMVSWMNVAPDAVVNFMWTELVPVWAMVDTTSTTFAATALSTVHAAPSLVEPSNPSQNTPAHAPDPDPPIEPVEPPAGPPPLAASAPPLDPTAPPDEPVSPPELANAPPAPTEPVAPPELVSTVAPPELAWIVAPPELV